MKIIIILPLISSIASGFCGIKKAVTGSHVISCTSLVNAVDSSLGLVTGILLIVCILIASRSGTKELLGLTSKQDILWKKDKNNEEQSVILSCFNTTVKIDNKDVPSVFVYDRNDPTGLSIKGLFYLYPLHIRVPQDSLLPHKGYIKIDASLISQSQHWPSSPFYNHIGADFALCRSKLSEIRARKSVWNGALGMPLNENTSTALRRFEHLGRYNRVHAYIKNWADSA